MPVLAATTLDGSTWQVGLLTTFAGLPFLLIGLPVGAWSDRVRRRPLLITADLGRAAVLAWVPIGYVLGVLTIEQLYVVQLLVGVGTVFFDVSQGAYLPDLVGRARLVEANIPFTSAGVGLLFYVVGAGMVAFWITTNNVIAVSLRQTLCPYHLLGRMNATTRFLAWATLPLGGVVGGALGTSLGLRPTLWLTSAGLALSALWLVLSPSCRTRDLPHN